MKFPATTIALGAGLLVFASDPVNVDAISHNTTFTAERDGFRFKNSFDNPKPFKDGLCGGMVYSSLDYFYTRDRQMPTVPFPPNEGHELRHYIFWRQVDSVASLQSIRWLGRYHNPSVQSLLEHHEHEILALKTRIDANQPTSIGLLYCSWGCSSDHQVLVTGYDFGKYPGKGTKYIEDVRIFVYDPNYPLQTQALKINVEGRFVQYVDNRSNKWQSFFIDNNFKLKSPPKVLTPHTYLAMTFETGADDLRGDLLIQKDNLNIRVFSYPPRHLYLPKVNGGKRWQPYSKETVIFRLPDKMPSSELRTVKLSTTQTCTWFWPDYWDLNGVVIAYVNGKSPPKIIGQRRGSPFKNFHCPQNEVLISV